MKIAITGGHLTPALAFIEYAQTQPNTSLLFIGRQYSQSNQRQLAREAIEVAALNVPFINLEVPRFSQRSPLSLARDFINYPLAIANAIWILQKNQPTVLLSFGGYLAVPLVLAAWLLRITIITHEQTVVAGSANQFIAYFANAIGITFADSKKYFPALKTTVVGNPIRPSLLAKAATKPSWLQNPPNKPIIFITGGNQGSYCINTTVSHILPQLTRKYTVIHACGSSTTQMNYLQDLEQEKAKLSPNQQESYYIREWISPEDLAWILRHTALAVSRAGANTVQELLFHTVPALFIPLPFAKNDEQTRNAQVAVKTGGAEIIIQSNLTPALLLEKINQKVALQKSLKQKLSKLELPTDGAARLYQLVTDHAPTTQTA